MFVPCACQNYLKDVEIEAGNQALSKSAVSLRPTTNSKLSRVCVAVVAKIRVLLGRNGSEWNKYSEPDMKTEDLDPAPRSHGQRLPKANSPISPASGSCIPGNSIGDTLEVE